MTSIVNSSLNKEYAGYTDTLPKIAEFNISQQRTKNRKKYAGYKDLL